MSWTSITQNGNGKMRARLVVEGLPYQFVTDQDMVAPLADGRIKTNGLQFEGLVIENSVDMPNAKIRASGISANIADIDGACTAAFATSPTVVTYITADVTVADTTVTVLSTDGFPASGVIHIGTEAIAYASKSATQFLGCTRQYWDTYIQAHYTVDGSNLRRSEVTNVPATVEGRRAYLFAYGDGDPPTGNGTQIFIGVVSRDAALSDSVYWQITVDPITRILDADLGGSLADNLGVRGVYYPALASLRVILRQSSSPDFFSTAPIAFEADGWFTGFFETQSDFCAALTDYLATLMVGWDGTLYAVSDGDSGWHLEWSPTAAKWLFADLSSPVDNIHDFLLTQTGLPIPGLTVVAGSTYVVSQRPNSVNYSLGTLPFIAQPGAVPRGLFCGEEVPFTVPSGWSYSNPEVAAIDTFPMFRMYLAGAGNVTTLQSMNVAGDVNGTSTSNTLLLDQTQANLSDGSVVGRGFITTPPRTIAWAGQSMTLEAVNLYVQGDVADFITEINFLAPIGVNIGTVPGLYGQDLQPSFGLPIRDVTQGRAIANRRSYVSVKKSKFVDYLAEELKLIGMYPYINTSGLIAFRELRLPAPSEPSTATIDASNELVSEGWSTWERNAMGTVNSVRMRTRYNASADAHEGPEFYIRDVTAYSRNRTPRIIEVAPKSESDTLPTPADLQSLFSRVLGIFGRPYVISEINVPWSLFDVVPGDIVLVTSATLPNAAGKRGLVDVQGLVMGRRFEIGTASGSLTVLIHNQNVAGYSPTARITTTVNVSGNTWDIGITNLPGYGSAQFNVGDRIRITEWDSLSALGNATGVIVTAGASPFRVTLDAPWVPGASTWNLEYASATDPALLPTQENYCFIAGLDGIIFYRLTTQESARTFAP